MLITDLLVKHFEKVMDFEFTAGMEEELDEIEEGTKNWVKVIRHFYDAFGGQVELAKAGMETVKREAEPTDEICDKKNVGPDGVEAVCGKPMVIKWGRRGRFMSCSAWPECKNAKSISTNVVCPQCKQGKLVMRRAKSGKGRAFYGCTRYPDCNFLANKLPKEGDAHTPSENVPPAESL
jgi:DNA topoisomerase-1